MRAGAVVALLHDRMDPVFYRNLLEAYKPEYICFPDERPEHHPGWTELERFDSYSLVKTDYLIDYSPIDDLALLLTTSGSTGSPKFVRQSYRNVASNTQSIAEYLSIRSADKAITTMPMSYTFMLSIINSHLYKGASLVFTEATLLDKTFWQLVKTQKVTTMSGVPYTYEILKKLRFDQMNLPDLKYITQAGGKLSLELSKEFAEVCEKKGIRFIVMYGQTEATARMSYLPYEYSRSKAGSMGIAIPGGHFWLEDDNGNTIEQPEVMGELVYKGDNVTLGYAENCHDLAKNDENHGILYTGDLAKRDADGFYYITGRKKRFLKLFGNRINLNEVEEMIRSTGYDCACTGTDDKMKIFVTEKENHDKIRKYISERTGLNQAAFTVVFIEKFPRNESGKVLYSALD
jgi:acyl-coenzyme A synthetase/AMP-(fatty) acid ligase